MARKSTASVPTQADAAMAALMSGIDPAVLQAALAEGLSGGKSYQEVIDHVTRQQQEQQVRKNALEQGGIAKIRISRALINGIKADRLGNLQANGTFQTGEGLSLSLSESKSIGLNADRLSKLFNYDTYCVFTEAAKDQLQELVADETAGSFIVEFSVSGPMGMIQKEARFPMGHEHHGMAIAGDANDETSWYPVQAGSPEAIKTPQLRVTLTSVLGQPMIANAPTTELPEDEEALDNFLEQGQKQNTRLLEARLAQSRANNAMRQNAATEAGLEAMLDQATATAQ